MNKFLCLISLTISVIALSSCSTTESLEEISPYSAQGQNTVTVIDNIEETAFINSNTSLPSSLPIYTNSYAYNQEGPMFQVDDEVKSATTSNLTLFLNYLYEEDAESSWDISTHPDATHQVYYENNDLRIWSAMSGLSIMTHAFDLPIVSPKGEFLNNPLIEAAIKYLDISSPQITSNIEYSSNGVPFEYQYKITDLYENDFQKILARSFSYISISYLPDADDVLVQICKIDVPENSTTTQCIPFDEAVEYIQKTNPNLNTENLHAEIYYSSTVNPGFFVPCYKFYLENTSADIYASEYYTIDISMVPTVSDTQ